MVQEVMNAVAADFSDLGETGRAATVAFRLLLAACLGGALGYERESAGKAAGIRTHMLVAIGAAIFLMAATLSGAGDNETSRIIQGIVAGIGFLGAGAIVKGNVGHEVVGLTTAATIWMTAAIGVAVGMGQAGTAVISTTLALIVLAAMQRAFLWIHPANGNASKSPTPPAKRESDA
jgi:putative Mg2+ transporter-C (MgtC) family protein